MKAPTRLSDPKSNASGLLRVLLHAGQTDLPDAARMRTLAARLGPLVGGGVAGGTGGGSGALGTAKGSATATALKAVAAAILVGAVGGGAFLGLRQTPTTTTEVPAARTSAPLTRTPILAPPVARAVPTTLASTAKAPMAPTKEPPVVVAVSSPAAAPLPTPNASAVGSATSPTTDTATGTTFPSAHSSATPSEPAQETEIGLLQEAQAALRDSPTTALALADRHASRFASGALVQEREVIAIEALLKLNRSGEARERGARFLSDFPNSAHQPRIETLLGGSDHNP
jgi:hypothetical protein